MRGGIVKGSDFSMFCIIMLKVVWFSDGHATFQIKHVKT